MQLTRKEQGKLSEVLLNAFTLAALRRLLYYQLDRDLEHISIQNTYQDIVFDVVGAAAREYWAFDLLVAARQVNPRNEKLMLLANRFGLAIEDMPTKKNLERIINETDSFLDVTKWRERLGEVETQVCSIEIRNQPAGTGILLGPDVLMTNYHVLQDVIAGSGEYRASDVSVRFDFKRLHDGTVINSGIPFKLPADDWLIDYSPYSPLDSEQDSTGVPTVEELDYVLFRVDGTPGDEPVGGDKGDLRAEPRGWLKPYAREHDFLAKPALFIIQHPNGRPLKLAFDTKAVLSVNENRTRVRYKTATDPGSSGSPCFDHDWNLIALHHSGDPSFIPSWNEGIPFHTILSLLEKRGIRDELGEQEE
ncbi:serine protease [Chloroflexi bacterium TSY]|nr:serine protease [Chloroflexi bacterium TSY]